MLPATLPTRSENASQDASPRPRTDGCRLAPLQEAARTERAYQGAAQAQVLREAMRCQAARQTAPAERHPEGENAGAGQVVSVSPRARPIPSPFPGERP